MKIPSSTAATRCSASRRSSSSRQVRVFIVLLLLSGPALAQTSAVSPLPSAPVPKADDYSAGPPRPTYEEFFSRIRYPYHATPEQQRRIERTARLVRLGWTEARLVKLLGPPDYKAQWFHNVGRGHTKETVLDEYWHYIYSMDGPSRPEEPGRLLVIGLSNRSKPRRVIQVDGNEIPGLKRLGVPKS